MKTLFRQLAVVSFALLSACQISACQTTVILPSSITMKWHETRRLEPANLEVRLDDVTDSRCPINALCIWEGDGVASFSVKDLSNGQVQTVDLHINQGVGSDSTTLAGFTVRMVELNPFPGTPNPPKLPEGYTVTLTISRAKQ